METQTVTMGAQKTIALVAHDNKKPDLLAWAQFNRHVLAQHRLRRQARPARCSKRS